MQWERGCVRENVKVGGKWLGRLMSSWRMLLPWIDRCVFKMYKHMNAIETCMAFEKCYSLGLFNTVIVMFVCKMYENVWSLEDASHLDCLIN